MMESGRLAFRVYYTDEDGTSKWADFEEQPDRTDAELLEMVARHCPTWQECNIQRKVVLYDPAFAKAYGGAARAWDKARGFSDFTVGGIPMGTEKEGTPKPRNRLERRAEASNARKALAAARLDARQAQAAQAAAQKHLSNRKRNKALKRAGF
jgi:hypothetical protein